MIPGIVGLSPTSRTATTFPVTEMAVTRDPRCTTTVLTTLGSFEKNDQLMVTRTRHSSGKPIAALRSGFDLRKATTRCDFGT
jgi:hypothetical protein